MLQNRRGGNTLVVFFYSPAMVYNPNSQVSTLIADDVLHVGPDFASNAGTAAAVPKPVTASVLGCTGSIYNCTSPSSSH